MSDLFAVGVNICHVLFKFVLRFFEHVKRSNEFFREHKCMLRHLEKLVLSCFIYFEIFIFFVFQ